MSRWGRICLCCVSDGVPRRSLWVALIVENLAEGMTQQQLLQAYPQLQPEDLQAALAYAAELTRERVLPPDVEVR